MLEALLQRYRWFDHPEGMKFVELERTAARSVGHWLFLPGSRSAFHRVTNADEVWAIHAGRLDLHLLGPGGRYDRILLGLRVELGESPVAVVPRGYWQAAELVENTDFAFGTNICAPGFSYDAFELAARAPLRLEYPDQADVIHRLTHPS